MKLGAILILTLLAGCDVIHEGNEYLWDTETDEWIDTEVTDPECLDADICTQATNPKCRKVGDMDVLRWLTGSCHCEDGEQRIHYAEERCLEGCVSNSNGADWCTEDAPES